MAHISYLPVDETDGLLGALRTLTGSPSLSRALAFDWRAAELGAFDDAAILDICQVAAYYNHVNRLARETK